METMPRIPLVKVESLVSLRSQITEPKMTRDYGGKPNRGVPHTDHVSQLEGAEFCSLDMPYSFALKRDRSDSFAGQLVVDLGAGTTTGGYEIATMNGARGYIGVERFNFSGLLKAFQEEFDPVFFNFKGRLPNAALVNADMLDFLRSLPDGSVSLLTCGIDQYILPTESYQREVKSEMRRVIHPSGKHVSFNSPVLYLGS